MSNDKQGWSSREQVSYEGVSEDGPAALDEGVYYGTIISAEATSSKAGKPCIKVVFEVERDYAGNKPQGRQMKAYSTIPVQSSTAFRILQIANVFGLTAPTVYGYEEISDFANQLVDKGAYVRMTQREYDGRVNNNLDRFLSNDKAAEEAGAASNDSNVTTVASGRKGRRAA